MRFFICLKSLFKIFNRKFLKIVFCLLCVSFLLFSPLFIFNEKNYELNLNKYLNLTDSPKVVLNLWHIETFEGGTNSRTKFLEKQAIKFNKQNSNCFISVTKMTEEQLYLNLNEGKFADIYSFGIGAGCLLLNQLIELEDNANIRNDLIEYGKINNKILAYPFILSGYCLISHENLLKNNDNKISFQNILINKKQINGIGFSTGSFLNPSQILLCNNYSGLKEDIFYTNQTTYNAYCNFVSKKFVSLLGTARDVARCKNREANGNLGSCRYDYMSGYSDLIQYVSISNKLTGAKKDLAINFTKYLTLEESQKDLKNYGLFSVSNLKIYENDYMKDFENALSKEILSINVFNSQTEIENKKNVAFNLLFS